MPSEKALALVQTVGGGDHLNPGAHAKTALQKSLAKEPCERALRKKEEPCKRASCNTKRDLLLTRTRLDPEAYHEKMKDKDTVIVDVRNHYEAEIGRFVGQEPHGFIS